MTKFYLKVFDYCLFIWDSDGSAVSGDGYKLTFGQQHNLLGLRPHQRYSVPARVFLTQRCGPPLSLASPFESMQSSLMKQ